MAQADSTANLPPAGVEPDAPAADPPGPCRGGPSPIRPVVSATATTPATKTAAGVQNPCPKSTSRNEGRPGSCNLSTRWTAAGCWRLHRPIGCIAAARGRDVTVTERRQAVGRRAFPWTSSERFPFGSTVGGDLGERRVAQRFPGGLLTRKRSQVQTLSRPPASH
jgi:hypothetical protein